MIQNMNLLHMKENNINLINKIHFLVYKCKKGEVYERFKNRKISEKFIKSFY